MALNSDRPRRESAPLPRRANRDTSASWTIGHDQPVFPSREPNSAADENLRRSSGPSFTGIDSGKTHGFPPSKKSNNRQSSISEVFEDQSSSARRKALRTSQHTTIVHGRQRSKSGSHLAAFLEAPQPRSSHRHSSLLPGDSSSIPQEQERPKRAIDDLRRDVEGKFYEDIDHNGTVRRRSMIRNVSRDDYLLARGANPRTGIVTPGCHGASSSLEEAEILRKRGIALPPKWRQRGDEWISLEFGQPTPILTPSKIRGSKAIQGIRTPQRIASGELPHESLNSPSSRGHHTPEASIYAPITTPTGVPGTYPETPMDLNSAAFTANTVAGHSIPRKAVGSPAGKRSEQQPSPLNAAVRHGQVVDAARSSSAPFGAKPTVFSPGDVGKNLPPLPSQDDPKLVNNTAALPSGNPFLGQRRVTPSESVRKFVISDSCGLVLADKELPCPPMSDGQSQSPPSSDQKVQITSQTLGRSPEHLVQTRILGPRGMNLEYPYIRNTRQRMPPNIEMRREHPQGSRPMPVPFYDNPPHQQPEPPMLQQVPMGGPQMQKRTHHPPPNDIDDVFSRAAATTTINTGMYTNMDCPGRKRYPVNYPQSFPDQYPRDEGRLMANPIVKNGHRQQMANSMSMNMNLSSLDLMSVPVPRNRPKASSRPQMLGRAEGMHSIPRIKPTHMRPNMTFMEPPPQWNTTGMHHRSGVDNGDIDSLIPERPHRSPLVTTLPEGSPHIHGQQNHPTSQPVQHGETLPRAHQQSSTLPGGIEDSGKIPPGVALSSPSGLSRRCSRCKDGFVNDHQRNIDGATPTSQELPSTLQQQHHPINLNTWQEDTGEDCCRTTIQKHGAITPLDIVSVRPASAREITAVSPSEPDQRDHSICCPECCKEQDCHEGCLGHPSPTPSPVRSIRSSIDTVGSGNESPSSAKESDAQSNTSDKVRIGRLAFMRSAFKKSFQDRPMHSRGYSRTSIVSKKSTIAELDSPPIDLSTHPLSPGAFWGGVATQAGNNTPKGDAVEAAKSATGLKKNASVSSDEVAAPSPLRVKKTRKKRLDIADLSRNLTAPTTPVASGEERKNESRRVASGPSLRMTTPSGTNCPRSASGASIATIEIPVPQFGSLGFGAIWEMIMVPFEASRMWLRNHPQILSLAWRVIERAYEMGQVMALTASKLWTAIFVYSKTGRLKLKRGETAGGFMLDCMMSAVYLLIFMAIGVAAMRVIKWILDVMGVLGMMINGVVWIVKKLLGYGLFW